MFATFMIDQMDALMLARIQFAFVISWHIIFPAFSIGLASWLTVLEFRWLRTGEPIYVEVYKHWVKIFAVVFGLGVVSGVVMSFQFGTNWAVFSDRAGNILGPLLAFEVLTAQTSFEFLVDNFWPKDEPLENPPLYSEKIKGCFSAIV